jgi:hypothetical protein
MKALPEISLKKTNVLRKKSRTQQLFQQIEKNVFFLEEVGPLKEAEEVDLVEEQLRTEGVAGQVGAAK